MTFGSKNAGTRIAEKTLAIAKKYQFTEFTLNLLTLLRESYTTQVDKRRFIEYNQQIDHYLQLLEAELTSEELLDMLQMESRLRKVSHDDLLALSQKLYAQQVEIVNQFESFKIRLNHYRLTVIYNALHGNLDAVRTACDDARAYLNANSNLSQRVRIGEFGLLKLQAFVNNQQANIILDEIDDLLECFTIGGINWFLTLEFGIQAHIQCGDYQRAYELWMTGHRSGALPRTSPRIQEMWFIFEAYLNVFNMVGSIVMTPDVGQIDDISTYTAAAPELSKEQASYNVHILITQICLMIIASEFETAMKRMEYLRLYVSQYLKATKDSPLRWFITRITDLAKAKFDVDRFEHSKGRNETLQRNGKSSMSSEEFREVLSLDVLFQSILDHIQRNQRQTKERVTRPTSQKSLNNEVQ